MFCCSVLPIDADSKIMRVHSAISSEVVLGKGDYISMNDTTGEETKGEQERQRVAMCGNLEQFMKWLDAHRRMEAFMNADTPKNARGGGGWDQTNPATDASLCSSISPGSISG